VTIREACVTTSALTTGGALVELDDSRSQVERLAIRPVHGLVELDGVPEGGPDAAGHHDHGLVDGVVIGLADRQSLGTAVDGRAFDLRSSTPIVASSASCLLTTGTRASA